MRLANFPWTLVRRYRKLRGWVPCDRRFILLGQPRVGSKLLGSYLVAHPRIELYGELFSLHDAFLHRAGAELSELLQDPERYLQTRFYEKRVSRHTLAVGFKIFYTHASRTEIRSFSSSQSVAGAPVGSEAESDTIRESRVRMAEFVRRSTDLGRLEEGLEGVWRRLKGDRNLIVVHLKRRNLLRSLVSLRIALLSDEWRTTDRRCRKATQTHVTTSACAACFAQTERWIRQYEEDFREHTILSLFYEDLVAEKEPVLRRLCTGLGVPAFFPETSLVRQNPQPLSSLVSNYQELRDGFRGTEYEVFFDA